MDKLRNLTADEEGQLQAFAGMEGRKWKHILAYEYWWRGLPVRAYQGGRAVEFPLLYGLRNSHGPSWLDGYRLRKAGSTEGAAS